MSGKNMNGKTMAEVTIYHNPKSSTSRNTLAMILNSGEEPRVIDYLLTPPDKTTLQKLIGDIGLGVRAILREQALRDAELDLQDAKWTDDEMINLMLRNPILINRPIVVTPLGTKLCRPSELVLDILPFPQNGEFTKESGKHVVNAQGWHLSNV